MQTPADLTRRLSILDQITAIYQDVVSPLETACHRGCAHCCTRNVSMTTLEGYAILERLPDDEKKALLGRVRPGSANRRFQPLATINQMADMCVAEAELPEEENEAAWGPCPILTDDRCPIYSIRPFGCRSMVSRSNCGENGYADMESFMFTVNTVFQQTIEQVDRPGCTGNFSDVLLYLSSADNRRQYEKNRPACREHRLLPNRLLKVLMIPPELRGRMGSILESLRNVGPARLSDTQPCQTPGQFTFNYQRS